jgi:KDO2-lipid IV(A) lauroyltransferase
MRAALGESYLPGMPLKVFMNHGDILIDAIRYAYMNDITIRQRVTVEGREHLDAALATGRGFMLITGHIGNWEILAHIPRLLGVEFCVMADTRRDPKHESIVDAIRSRSGATILPPKGKVRMIIRELKKGRTIGFVIDNRGDSGTQLLCTIFGMPATTNPAPALIAAKGNAMIVPVSAVKQRDTYVIRYEHPVDARAFQDDPIQSISDFMQSWVESVVRRYPDQWFWLYSRWIRRSEMRHIIRSGIDFRQYVLLHSDDFQG